MGGQACPSQTFFLKLSHQSGVSTSDHLETRVSEAQSLTLDKFGSGAIVSVVTGL